MNISCSLMKLSITILHKKITYFNIYHSSGTQLTTRFLKNNHFRPCSITKEGYSSLYYVSWPHYSLMRCCKILNLNKTFFYLKKSLEMTTRNLGVAIFAWWREQCPPFLELNGFHCERHSRYFEFRAGHYL